MTITLVAQLIVLILVGIFAPSWHYLAGMSGVFVIYWIGYARGVADMARDLRFLINKIQQDRTDINVG